MDITNKQYTPFDNSFCINIKTGKDALVVQRTKYDFDYCGPDKKEDGAIFKVVSELPYVEYLTCFGFKTFVNIKSSKTGNIYRVLYNQKSVVI